MVLSVNKNAGHTYVISDLHGTRLPDLKELLNKAAFSSQDHLYVLGDAIDRNGHGGIGLLLWMMKQDNVTFLLGNHEASLIVLENYIRKHILPPAEEPIIFQQIAQYKKRAIKYPQFNVEETRFLLYCADGGMVTIQALRELYKQNPQRVEELFDYLHKAPVYQEINVNNQDYILCHSGIDHFKKNKPLSNYKESDFLNCWPELTSRFYDDKILVFGHTPTGSLDKTMKGKIIYTDSWIDIDVGAGWGKMPVLLRLDDMKEFK